jgi:serine/threonine-protein kinase HipA
MVVDNGKLRFAREGEQGRYILKIAPIEPHIIDRPWVPINEWVTMRIAEQVYGIPTAKNTLCYFGNGAVAYVTRRFDVQLDGSKWLQEDFASIANISKDTDGPDYKYNALSYAECGALIDKHVSAAMVEKLKFFRIVVFNYLTCNDDAHLKNFSLYAPKGQHVLSPAYDLVNTLAVMPSDPEELALNLNGKKRKIGWRDWSAAMTRSGVPEKVQENMRKRFVQVLPQWEETIRGSFLTEAMQERYLEIVRTRMGQMER